MKNSNFNVFQRVSTCFNVFQCVSTCFIFCLLSQFLFSQSNLFQDVLETDFANGMNAEQKNKHDKIKKNKHYKSVKTIKMGDIKSMIDKNIIRFKIPGYNKTIEAKATFVQTHSLQKYIWIGQLTDNSGTVLFNVNNGKVTGHLYIDTDMFEIMDMGNSKNLFVSIDEKRYTEQECYKPRQGLSNNITNISPPITPTELTTRSLSVSCNNIRVLVLYAPAVSLVSDPQSLAQSMIALTNNIMLNSRINNVTFELAGVQLFTENVMSTDIGLTQRNLQTNDEAMRMRDEANADLVVLFTDENFRDNANPVFGAASWNRGANPNDAYCVVEADATAARMTMPHELAHLMGAGHEDYEDPSARGKIFTTPRCRKCFVFFICCENPISRRTLVTTLPLNQVRIPFCSNPDVLFEGVSTGDFDRNNAQMIRGNGSAVANFRPALFNGSISGPYYANTGDNLDFCLETCSCSSNISANWEFSYDGFNFYSLGASNCSSITMPHQQFLYLRATVTCGSGQSITLFHTVTNNADLSGCLYCLQRGNDVAKADAHTEKTITDKLDVDNYLELSPNPSIDVLNIDYEVKESGSVRIDIFDHTGKIIKNIANTYKSEGLHKEVIQTNQFPTGIYMCRIQVGNNIFNRRFVINH